MSLRAAFRCNPRPDVGVRLTRAGQVSPAVQYTVACLLAESDSPRSAALALRALRPITELVPSPWLYDDPSLRDLRQRPETKRAFFRMVRGSTSPVERATLLVEPTSLRLGAATNATVEATLSTRSVAGALALEVELGIGNPYSDPGTWKQWARMRLDKIDGGDIRLVHKWKPTEVGLHWLFARVRRGGEEWSYIDCDGIDISDPAKSGLTDPCSVDVRAAEEGGPKASRRRRT